ncbi:MAG: trehalose-phosphatase [Gammaproteobacteria bacterium]
MSEPSTPTLPLPPPIAQLVSDPGEWALFLDFDGTLVDLAASPDAIQVPPALSPLLSDLRERFGGALAVLTGRALADLDRHLPGARLAAAGQHGAELRRHPQDRETVVESPALGAARIEFEHFGAEHPGVFMEDKGASLALHYRAAPEARAVLVALAETAAAASAGTLELIHGKAVCELRPAGSDKGRALRGFLAVPPFAGRRPLVLGDDVTDEEAFAAALNAGGAAIKVGEGATCAHWRLATPATARTWLAGILER